LDGISGCKNFFDTLDVGCLWLDIEAEATFLLGCAVTWDAFADEDGADFGFKRGYVYACRNALWRGGRGCE